MTFIYFDGKNGIFPYHMAVTSIVGNRGKLVPSSVTIDYL